MSASREARPAAAGNTPASYIGSFFRPSNAPAGAAAPPAGASSPAAAAFSPEPPPPRASLTPGSPSFSAANASRGSPLPPTPATPTPILSSLGATASRVVASASDALGGRALTVFVLALTAIAVGGLVFVIVRWTINRNALQKKSALIAETRVPRLGTQLVQASGSGVPASANGRRRTVAFWLYVHDAGKFSGVYRHVFHRGSKDDWAGSPSVFLDKRDSSLIVRFKRVGEPSLDYAYDNRVVNVSNTYKMRQDTPAATPTDKVASDADDDALHYDLATHGVKIANFPTQRWVHVAIVLNEASNGGTITTYVDGEVVSQTRSGDPIPQLKSIAVEKRSADEASRAVVPPDSKLVQFGALDLDAPGDVWIGGSLFETVGPGFSGLVSRIQFWNYDLNPRDVFDVYAQGPVDGVAAKLGLPTYGVRSPVYRMA